MSTKSTITEQQQADIAAFLNTHDLLSGLGNEASACSIASINLALTGRLTDEIPDCMSQVIGHWIIMVQDAMPATMRNSQEWKRLLPLAVGTGRELEMARRDVILDWMWTVTLPQVQPAADELGFGESWREMCERRTPDATYLATSDASYLAAIHAEHATASAHGAVAARTASAYADHADHAATAARSAAYADRADHAATAARSAAYAAFDAPVAYIAARAAARAAVHAATNAADTYWRAVDPCALLAKLIEVSR